MEYAENNYERGNEKITPALKVLSVAAFCFYHNKLLQKTGPDFVANYSPNPIAIIYDEKIHLKITGVLIPQLCVYLFCKIRYSLIFGLFTINKRGYVFIKKGVNSSVCSLEQLTGDVAGEISVYDIGILA